METQALINTQSTINVPAATPAIISQSSYSAEPQSGSLLDYWRAICRRRLLLTACGVTGLGLGLAITLPQAPSYRSTTSIEIQDIKNDSFTKLLNQQQNDSASTPDSLTDIPTQIKILQSRTLIEKALDKAHISAVAGLERSANHTAPWRHLFSTAAPTAADSREALVEKAANNLKVSAASDTRIVEISFEAADPTVAADFANALTSEYIEQNLQARWQMNRKTSDWLVGQLDEMRHKLQQSGDALQAYARSKGLIYTGDKQIVSEEKLRELQVELSKAQAERMEKQSRYEIARGVAPESVPEVLNDNNLRSMENNQVDLQKQEAEMRVTFKPDYSKAKALHAEIESLQSAIEGKRQAIVSRLDNELQESERREHLLASAYANQTRLVSGDSEKSIQYDMLKHDVDTNAQIYQVMLQRVKESNIASALNTTNVRVIDPAKAPLHPNKPKLPINAGGGLLIGLMAGVIGTIIRSKVDSTVQEPGEVGLLLGIPELGVIPASFNKVPPVRALFSRSKTQQECQSLQVITATNSCPKTSDSFRAVLASILFAGARQRHRVLVITSPSPSEGKSTTTSNLAVTLANMGRRVLLIDGDIRSPRIHNLFGLENTDGLTTMLTQIGLSNNVTDNFIRETSVPNLHVLTSGPTLHSGADLLFSTSMPALIARYRNEYDMVLIDTPPMLVMPDARALARAADAVVLVVRAQKTTRSAIQAAYRRFVEDRTPVLGVVLNDWNADSSDYKYYAAYQRPALKQVVVATPAGAR